jgi:hypothetical protein
LGKKIHNHSNREKKVSFDAQHSDSLEALNEQVNQPTGRNHDLDPLPSFGGKIYLKNKKKIIQ